MKDFIYAALASQSFKDYNTIISDMAENEKRVSLSKICKKRDKFANKILAEIGTMDAERHEAFAFAHKILTVIDMIILKNSEWIDDMNEED